MKSRPATTLQKRRVPGPSGWWGRPRNAPRAGRKCANARGRCGQRAAILVGMSCRRWRPMG